jgi:hypothetical protein
LEQLVADSPLTAPQLQKAIGRKHLAPVKRDLEFLVKNGLASAEWDEGEEWYFFTDPNPGVLMPDFRIVRAAAAV